MSDSKDKNKASKTVQVGREDVNGLDSKGKTLRQRIEDIIVVDSDMDTYLKESLPDKIMAEVQADRTKLKERLEAEAVATKLSDGKGGIQMAVPMTAIERVLGEQDANT
jgi:hypothetical protein